MVFVSRWPPTMRRTRMRSTRSTFAESLRNMPSIITRCERMFRLGRTRPAHARSSGSETLLRIPYLAGYIIDTLESRFRKREAMEVHGMRHHRLVGDRNLHPFALGDR